jgi:hypothetical protein
MDIVSNLADPLHWSFALFEPRWVPRQVDVYSSTEPLKVEALACRISRAHEPNIARLDGRLDLLARDRATIHSALHEGRCSSCVECDRFIWKRFAERF